MRYVFPLFLLLSCLLTFLPGCEPKEDLVQTSGSLELEADTVLFDTVFTSIKTVTKRFWVYNRNSGAVKTDISLSGTAAGTYSLIINGDAGASASGVTIRGKDSLLLLVRAVLGDNGAAKPFLIADEVHFRTNGNDQNVKLVAYGQNAYFHRAAIVGVNTTWATDKPHVIVNANYTPVAGGPSYPLGVAVLRGVTLTIPKGARIYSHAGAYLQVDGRLLVGQDFVPGTGSTDTVKATNANIVRFQGDRLEPLYADIPGQWGGIVFTATSTGNRIRYAEIKNATFGALLYNPDNAAAVHPNLTLDNTVIRNISGANLSFANATASSGGGIISYSGDVTATNCLFTNCGEYAVLGAGGGTYDFNFCTFANFTPAFRRETSSLTFTNEQATNAKIKLPTSVTVRNSIIWGSFDDELFVKNYSDYAGLNIRNSVVRTKEYASTAAVVGPSNQVNKDPLFIRTSLSSNRPDYRVQDASPAASRQLVPFGTVPARDLLNLPRLTPAAPTLGAYEHK
jgi:type 1 fimbria pilin